MIHAWRPCFWGGAWKTVKPSHMKCRKSRKRRPGRRPKNQTRCKKQNPNCHQQPRNRASATRRQLCANGRLWAARSSSQISPLQVPKLRRTSGRASSLRCEHIQAHFMKVATRLQHEARQRISWSCLIASCSALPTKCAQFPASFSYPASARACQLGAAQ